MGSARAGRVRGAWGVWLEKGVEVEGGEGGRRSTECCGSQRMCGVC